jgi:hypothetical protein
MTWHHNRPTPSRPKRTGASDIFATLGGIAAVVIVALAMYYGLR